MAKKKKKTKEIEYAVKYLHDTMKMSANDISVEIGVEQAVVEGIINQPKDPKPRKVSKSQDLMIRHTSQKKINNVSIMTEAASELNDEVMKNQRNKSKRLDNIIYRPND